MPKSSTPAPSGVVVADWTKGPNEVVRVSLQKFRGHTILHIRAWYQSDDGTFLPGKNGIILLAEHATKIRKALKKAEEIAKVGEGDDE